MGASGGPEESGEGEGGSADKRLLVGRIIEAGGLLGLASRLMGCGRGWRGHDHRLVVYGGGQGSCIELLQDTLCPVPRADPTAVVGLVGVKVGSTRCCFAMTFGTGVGLQGSMLQKQGGFISVVNYIVANGAKEDKVVP